MNEFGGLTFEVKDEDASHFIKWFPAGQSHALRDEAARLAWAARFTPVPTVLGHGEDTAGAWMVTAALPGDNAVCDRWKADPRTAVTAIGQGLRALHDRLPVEDCPFTWAAEDRIAAVRQHARPSSPAPRAWTPPGHQVLDIGETLALLEDLPPVDRLVVCHGDACAPNTLLAEDGTWSGHVDLGRLGVADRWADLAIASWSLDWNYGPGWGATFFAAYGVEPDAARIAYYRLLWEAPY